VYDTTPKGAYLRKTEESPDDYLKIHREEREKNL